MQLDDQPFVPTLTHKLGDTARVSGLAITPVTQFEGLRADEMFREPRILHTHCEVRRYTSY